MRAGLICRDRPEMEDKIEREDKGVEEGDWERKKMFGKGVAARSLVRKLVKVEENEEDEVEAAIAVSVYLPVGMS